jgi:hypothetical protein
LIPGGVWQWATIITLVVGKMSDHSHDENDAQNDNVEIIASPLLHRQC